MPRNGIAPQGGKPRRRRRNTLWMRFEFSLHAPISWQAPSAHGLAQLLERGHVAGERLPVGKLDSAITPLGVKVVEQAGGAALVRVLADVARILRLLQITGLVQLYDLIVGAERFVGIGHVGERNRGLFAGKLLGLRDRVLCPRDFALGAVEDRHLNVEEKRSRVDAAEVVMGEV